MIAKLYRLKTEIFILFMIFYLSNNRMLILSLYMIDDYFIVALTEVLLWIVPVVLIFRLLRKDGGWSVFVNAGRRNIPLLIFLAFAALSLSWSIRPGVTLYKVLVTLFATFAGGYLGVKYDLRQQLRIFTWLGIVIVVFCFEMVFLMPEFGRMFTLSFDGAWRGIYVHRNYLGTSMAFFNLIFLIHFFQNWQLRVKEYLIDGLFYFLSLALVVLSRSATGLIGLILLNAGVAAIQFWSKIRHRLRSSHYLFAGALFLIATILILSNLDFIFGLVGRNTTLTGRIPMWQYLFQEIISERPVFGYGFGAVWSSQAFRTQVQQAVGWSIPVVIADNGFIDIILYVGFLGLFLFLVVLGLMIYRALKLVSVRQTLKDFLPILIIVFAIVSNIALSLFMERDVFVWMLLVAGLYHTTHTEKQGETGSDLPPAGT